MNMAETKTNKIVPVEYSHILWDEVVIFFLQEYLNKPLEMKWGMKQGVKHVDEAAYVFSLDDFLYRYLYQRLYEQREWRKLDYVDMSLKWGDICEAIKNSSVGELFSKMCEEATKRYAMAKDVDYIIEQMKGVEGNGVGGNIIIIKNENK